jgi:hypothetical protein
MAGAAGLKRDSFSTADRIPDFAGDFSLGLPFGQPPFSAFGRTAAALVRLNKAD